MMVLSRSNLALLCVALAGCGGGGASPAGSLPSGSAMGQRAAPRDRHGCQNNGGVTVIPCAITFNAGNPGPITVSVLRNNDGERRGRGRIRERDNCGTQGVATIARDSRGVYVVTAGAMKGSCDAQFSAENRRGRNLDGDGNGNGNLHIINTL